MAYLASVLLLPLCSLARGDLLDMLPLANSTSVVFDSSISVPGARHPIKCYRIPMVVQSPQALIAFSEAREGSCHDCVVNGIAMRRSTDGGRTWGPYTWAVSDESTDASRPDMDVGGNPSAVYDAATGKVILQFVRGKLNDPKGQTCNPATSNWQIESSDGGLTWTKPVEISRFLGRYRGSLVGPANGIQLKYNAEHRDRLVWCGHWGVYHSTQVWYSDDYGNTYRLSSSVFDYMDECTVAELNDGRVYLNMRNRMRNGRAFATSSDGGATFGKLAFDPELISPVCQATLSNAGGHLLFANPASTTDRIQGTIRKSMDNGLTWTHELHITPPGVSVRDGGSFGYSCLVPDPMQDDRSKGGLLWEHVTPGGNRLVLFSRFHLGFTSTSTTTTPPSSVCIKWSTTGWHSGKYEKVLQPHAAPNGIEWVWTECAARCAIEAACEFWTLQLSGTRYCLMMSNRGKYHDTKGHAEGPKVAVGACKTTTTTATTTLTVSTTTTTTTTTTATTTSTSLGTAIQSGDTIFLKTRSGTGHHIDIEGSAVQARWESQGTWQAIVIEKRNSGSVNSGDTVYLKTHTGTYLDVTFKNVQARWNETGGWQAMVVEKRTGNGAIRAGDSVCFRAHTGKHLDVEGGVVQARWNDCGEWQAMLIEKEVVGAVFSGTSIHLLAHTGKRLEVEGNAVSARWSEQGEWQTFVIENYGGRAIFSGDAVFLKAHTGTLVDVEGVAVQARWQDWGTWQTLFIERKDGSGALMPGDTIYLRAHTGKMIEIEGSVVQARWSEKGSWQSLVIEKSAPRRLTENAAGSSVLGHTPGMVLV